MHKVFYIKQQDNEGSEIKFSDNQSLWKVPVVRTVNRVFSRLANPYYYSDKSVFPRLYNNRVSSSTGSPQLAPST